jgi:iron complex transport system permease protein
MLTTNQSKPCRIPLLLAALALLSIVSITLSISIGSVHISLPQLAHALLEKTDTIQHEIIFNLRIPRTLCAFIIGGSLALAGALMQILLRNPLADPYVLGVSGGAAVASLIALMIGVLTNFLYLWAFAGSLLSMLLVIGLAHNRDGFSSLRLLLTGVVVATGWGAMISFILTISPQTNLRSMLFWLMGDLSYAHFSYWQLLILLLGLLISFVFAKPLNVLARGNLTAQSLGVNPRRLSWMLYIISSLLTACAVSMAGCIGFVGLIVPHMLRLVGNSDHRFILPGSVLLGGSLLTLADTLARSVMAPIQLPVGVVTAIIGVPCFLFLLRGNYKK